MECDMNEQNIDPGDARLSALLRAERPTADLPPSFGQNVWRRIERAEQHEPGIIEWLARLLVTPRIAIAGLALVVVLAGGIGAARGVQTGHREARDKYLASVDPAHFGHGSQ
jgi:hypothetical protein